MTGLLFLCSATASFSQTPSAKEFFSNTGIPLTYLGIDFYQAKLINDPNANPSDIKGRIYGSMNDVVVNEAKNFDMQGAFHHTVTSDLKAITDRNDKIDPNISPQPISRGVSLLSLYILIKKYPNEILTK